VVGLRNLENIPVRSTFLTFNYAPGYKYYAALQLGLFLYIGCQTAPFRSPFFIFFPFFFYLKGWKGSSGCDNQYVVWGAKTQKR
jgi:hypothetical protein